MSNSGVMFRKIVDHPYLVHFPLDPNQTKKCLLINEDLITSSGKMMVLDVLLDKLKKRGHKVGENNTFLLVEKYLTLLYSSRSSSRYSNFYIAVKFGKNLCLV